MREFKTADELENYINKTIDARFTDDYFRIKLPEDLKTSAAISPSWYGYLSSQIVLGYPMLFSTTSLSNMLSVGSSGTKNAIDKHHIFPKNYLSKLGIEKDRDRNQIANFTYLDYNTNIYISDRQPQDYISEFKNKLDNDEYSKCLKEHAIPEGFENMNYFDFIQKRRLLMAQIVKKAYEKLCNC